MTDWHLAFWSHADTNGLVVTAANYYTLLYAFIQGAGAQYNGLIKWKNASNAMLGIQGAFMIGHYKESAVIDAEHQVDAMFAIRDDMREIVGSDENIFAFTFKMLYWEQYAVIAKEFYRNLLLSISVVFVITLILIPNISTALLVIFTVVCTIIDVLGFMFFWGLSINAVTVCYTVIAIGLSVDYSAHIGEAFMISTKPTKGDKVVDALYRIGASVFNGAFSTYLAVVVVGNAQTYIFRVFFKEIFLVTVIGSAHGLLVLPVLLSWCGPNGADENQKKNDDDELELHEVESKVRDISESISELHEFDSKELDIKLSLFCSGKYY